MFFLSTSLFLRFVIWLLQLKRLLSVSLCLCLKNVARHQYIQQRAAQCKNSVWVILSLFVSIITKISYVVFPWINRRVLKNAKWKIWISFIFLMFIHFQKENKIPPPRQHLCVRPKSSVWLWVYMNVGIMHKGFCFFLWRLYDLNTSLQRTIRA